MHKLDAHYTMLNPTSIAECEAEIKAENQAIRESWRNLRQNKEFQRVLDYWLSVSLHSLEKSEDMYKITGLPNLIQYMDSQ
jgi:hypothetical protein